MNNQVTYPRIRLIELGKVFLPLPESGHRKAVLDLEPDVFDGWAHTLADEIINVPAWDRFMKWRFINQCLAEGVLRLEGQDLLPVPAEAETSPETEGQETETEGGRKSFHPEEKASGSGKAEGGNA